MDILEKRIRRRVYSRRVSKVTPERKREQKRLYNIRYIINKIKTGDFNRQSKSHMILLNSAIKQGYVDKDLNILIDP